MSFSQFLPSKESCQEFLRLFNAAIQLNHGSGWNLKYFEIKNQKELHNLKQKFPWFSLAKIYRHCHFAEGDCMCSKTTCVCFHYKYLLPDEWSIQVEEVRK